VTRVQLDAGNLVATCAFCGASVKPEAPGILAIEVGSTRVEGSQAMFIHATCLAEQLDDSFPFDPELFEPDKDG
jgi:hypothetical protein